MKTKCVLLKTCVVLSLIVSLDAKAAVNPDIDPVNITTKEGFAFKALQTKWFRAPAPPGRDGIAVLFRSPETANGFQPLMTVRVDKNTSGSKDIKAYIKKWIGDYSKLGYEVLGSKAFKSNGEVAYVIDTRNKETAKQVRQVVFFRPEKAVILTCIDAIASFSNSLEECNNITRAFSWNTTASTNN